jgi:mannose PTS system EIIA component
MQFHPELIEPIAAGSGNLINVACFGSHEFAEKTWEHSQLEANRIGTVRRATRRCHRLMFARKGAKFPNEQVRSMIGIVLVTHGRLAAEFRAVLDHVAGPQKQIGSIAIGPDDDMEQRRQAITSAVTKVDSGAGVIVLTDMFGGTPSNLAISIMSGSNIEVIAGVNLAMLIKLASVRETSTLEQAVIQAHEAGRKHIYVASQVLGANPDQIEHVRQHELCEIAT